MSFHGLTLANEDENEKGLNACFTYELQASVRSIVTCEFATMWTDLWGVVHETRYDTHLHSYLVTELYFIFPYRWSFITTWGLPPSGYNLIVCTTTFIWFLGTPSQWLYSYWSWVETLKLIQDLSVSVTLFAFMNWAASLQLPQLMPTELTSDSHTPSKCNQQAMSCLEWSIRPSLTSWTLWPANITKCGMAASLYYSLVTNTVVAIDTRENVTRPLLHSL